MSTWDQEYSTPLLTRRAKLSGTWFFECGCEACSDPANDLGKHSARCGHPSCQGFVPVNVTSWNWADCVSCGQELSRQERFRYQEIFTMVREVVDENGGEYQCRLTRDQSVLYKLMMFCQILTSTSS